MVTTPYQRGRSKEYRVLHMLREEGWVCSRSAMSHGPVDVFAARSGKVKLIQVKSGNSRMSNADAVEFIAWAKAFKASGELWLFKRRGELIQKVLYSPRNGIAAKKNGGEVRIKT